MQGFDLFSPLTTGTDYPRHGAASTLYASCALVTRRWKLEWYLEDARGRLFDRIVDPDEQHDLFDNTVTAHIRDQLLISLLTWHAATRDLQWLQHKTNGGGPVARNVAAHTATLRGEDAERRLDERIVAMDAVVTPGTPPRDTPISHVALKGIFKEQPSWQ
jgi:hypothetical protein